ncbi:hypothetical protein BH20ACI3_BH20ACI3_19990 [soil metagenome]
MTIAIWLILVFCPAAYLNSTSLHHKGDRFDSEYSKHEAKNPNLGFRRLNLVFVTFMHYFS